MIIATISKVMSSIYQLPFSFLPFRKYTIILQSILWSIIRALLCFIWKSIPDL